MRLNLKLKIIILYLNASGFRSVIAAIAVIYHDHMLSTNVWKNN